MNALLPNSQFFQRLCNCKMATEETSEKRHFLRRKISRAYVVYRNTKVALALFDTIEELIEEDFLTPTQAVKLVSQFDYSAQKVMRGIQRELKDCGTGTMSLQGNVRTYRILKDDRVHVQHFLLKNVSVYQHFSIRQIQLSVDTCTEDHTLSAAKEKEFIKKKDSHEVRVFIGFIPYLLLVAQSYLEIPITTRQIMDPHLLRCKVDDAVNYINVNPRLAFYYLTPLDEPKMGELEEEEEEPVMLNRFKSSAMILEKHETTQRGKKEHDEVEPSTSKSDDINANRPKSKFNYTNFMKPNSVTASIKTSKPRKVTG